MATLFSRIIARELPADIVYEDEELIAFRDIHPEAPVHLLLCTKKEIPNLQQLKEEDYPLIAKLIQLAQKLAEQEGIADGYRLVTNCGEKAGQSIFHLHFHLLGGRPLGALT